MSDLAPKTYLMNLFFEGLEQCSPHRAIQKSLKCGDNNIKIKGTKYSVDKRPVYLFAVGKAAVPMYKQASSILGDHVVQSLVITSESEAAKSCKADEVIMASHPVPKGDSLQAGERAVAFMKSVPENAIVINLISGGTSSLLCLPSDAIPIEDLGRMFELLNHSGATIHDINTVRKHCSKIKGGQLLRYLKSNITLLDLVISDVPKDELSIVGSGPTVADASTYQDACHILLEYKLWNNMPKSIRAHIEKGMRSIAEETVKPGKDPIKVHQSEIISSARVLAQQIKNLATKEKLNVILAEEPFNNNVEMVAENIADIVLSDLGNKNDKSSLYIFWGESTVQVTGKGKGGRNQELALRGAYKIMGQENITWLSAGTDGIDGPTDAAGAVVNGRTIENALKNGLNPEYYLSNNDSYHFHQQMNTLLKPGPTGNNLMDVVLVFRETEKTEKNKVKV